jgi:hypothetical protein
VKVSGPILLAALAFGPGCASHDGPFVAAGKPRMPLHEARPHCKQQTTGVSAGGEATVDWRAYQRCMADLGWVKPPSDSPAGAPLPTGGGPSY